MYHEIMVVGRVGHVSEPSVTKNGTEVANFSVAVNERRGEEETTTWYGAVAWGNLSHVVTDFLEKGKLVMIKGRPRISTWKDKEDETQARMSISIDTLRILSKPPEREQASEESIPY